MVQCYCLPSSLREILREFTNEDNFNNTFALHSEVASQRYNFFSDNIYMLINII